MAKKKDKDTKKDEGTCRCVKWNVEGKIVEAETMEEAIKKANE